MDKIKIAAIGIGVIILLSFVCPMTAGGGGASIRWASAWMAEDAAMRETNAQRAALRVTDEWRRLNATPTPTPAPTSTPAPTVKGMVQDTGEILGMVFWGVFLAGAAVIAVWLIWRYGDAGALWVRNRAQTVARSSTGDVVILGKDGRLRKTATMIESESVPQPEPDALDGIERARQYVTSGELPAQPARELSRTNAPDATAAQRLALGATGQVASAMASALGDKTSRERLDAMRMMEAMGGRRNRRADQSMMEMVADTSRQLTGGQEQWRVVREPADIQVLAEPGAAGEIERAQVKHIAERCSLDGDELREWCEGPSGAPVDDNRRLRE